MRIAFQILGRQHDMLHLDAVVADEAMSEVVKTKSKLSAAITCFIRAKVGTKAKIGSAESQGGPLGVRGASDFAAGQPTGDIDPTVDAQRRVADS